MDGVTVTLHLPWTDLVNTLVTSLLLLQALYCISILQSMLALLLMQSGVEEVIFKSLYLLQDIVLCCPEGV
jgi:hypothetical protein